MLWSGNLLKTRLHFFCSAAWVPVVAKCQFQPKLTIFFPPQYLQKKSLLPDFEFFWEAPNIQPLERYHCICTPDNEYEH